MKISLSVLKHHVSLFLSNFAISVEKVFPQLPLARHWQINVVRGCAVLQVYYARGVKNDVDLLRIIGLYSWTLLQDLYAVHFIKWPTSSTAHSISRHEDIGLFAVSLIFVARAACAAPRLLRPSYLWWAIAPPRHRRLNIILRMAMG
jgi:hypothetical protein